MRHPFSPARAAASIAAAWTRASGSAVGIERTPARSPLIPVAPRTCEARRSPTRERGAPLARGWFDQTMSRRARTRYRQSLVALPTLYIVAAVLLGNLAPEIDDLRKGGTASVGTARDVLTATATGMIAFTGFVLAGVLLVVQFAAGQYSPRLVLWFRRDTLTKH